MGIIALNGVSSESLGVIVDGYYARYSAERNVDLLQIPGKNGSLLVDKGTYKTYSQDYTLYWVVGKTTDDSVLSWLQQGKYFSLVDSDFPGYTRKARVIGPLVPKNRGNCYVELNLSLECFPQWYSTAGDTWVNNLLTTPDTEATLSNPYLQYAKPLLHIGKHSKDDTMTVSINGYQFKLVPYGNTMEYYVDCELQEVYYQNSNRNLAFVGEFPQLGPGTNTLKFTGSTGSDAFLSIKPRWWTV